MTDIIDQKPQFENVRPVNITDLCHIVLKKEQLAKGHNMTGWQIAIENSQKKAHIRPPKYPAYNFPTLILKEGLHPEIFDFTTVVYLTTCITKHLELVGPLKTKADLKGLRLPMPHTSENETSDIDYETIHKSMILIYRDVVRRIEGVMKRLDPAPSEEN